MKAGWKTSEFWLTLTTQVIALLVMLGVVSSSDSSSVADAVKQIVASMFALVSSAVVLWKYIQSRLEVKKEELKVNSTNNNN